MRNVQRTSIPSKTIEVISAVLELTAHALITSPVECQLDAPTSENKTSIGLNNKVVSRDCQTEANDMGRKLEKSNRQETFQHCERIVGWFRLEAKLSNCSASNLNS